MAKTKIEWTEYSWTPIRARNRKTGKVGWHCEHATTGCEFCYAEGLNKWFGTGLLFKPGHRKDIEIFLDEDMLTAPLRWRKGRRIFVCSMTDAFAEFVTDEWIDKIFAVMALCPQHTFQVLTKRAERMREYVTCLNNEPVTDSVRRIVAAWPGNADMPKAGIDIPLPNVWLGVSCERQQEADERIPLLLQTPAAVRFISAEPLLGPIDLRGIRADDGECLLNVVDGIGSHYSWGSHVSSIRKLDWVIVGGESGPHARPMHPDWARALRDQCTAAGVAYFFKQWGNHVHATQCSLNAEDPWTEVWLDDNTVIARVGKKAAGRLLDGREHNEFPSSAT